jgi:methyl-accepting chemotaxis protein
LMCVRVREARLNAPTWSSDSGRPQARVVGTVSTDRHAVLAFAYIPLPPAAVEKAPSCDLWCEYKAVILGVVIGMGAFIAIATYAIIRLRRYRAKYKENQRNLQELKERAREIDEFAGGIGLADEAGEVDMVANPMVIEMKKLDQQLTEVNDQLNTQAEKDNRRIDQLSQERERLNAELNRMRAALAAQTRTAATRLEDVHISQPHYDASSAAVGGGGGGAGGLTSSGLVPMEMETPVRQEIEGYSADQQRHGFGQVRRPNKKKSDF